MPVKKSSCYALCGLISAQSPADATTYYFGTFEESTTAGQRKVYIPRSGIITVANVYSYSATAGSNEAWPFAIRVNGTTDYTIASLTLATNERNWRNTALNIPVVAGDFIELKTVCPTWVTNPANVRMGWNILIKV